MNHELEQYRFARVEGYRIVRSRLEKHFKDRSISLNELEQAVAKQLGANSFCAPWRTSELDQAGCREGMRLAALEFFWDYYQILQMNRHLSGHEA